MRSTHIHDLAPAARPPVVSHCLKAVESALGCLDIALPVEGPAANSEIFRNCIGLLPSGPTLPRCMDARSEERVDLIAPTSEALHPALRRNNGVQHQTSETDFNPCRTIPTAECLSPAGPQIFCLVRMVKRRSIKTVMQGPNNRGGCMVGLVRRLIVELRPYDLRVTVVVRSFVQLVACVWRSPVVANGTIAIRPIPILAECGLRHG